MSASSGSPSNHTSYHPVTPINQLRDMLATSDHEHSNSIDHNDVKDLSLRGQPHQAPVITSTAPTVVHLDTASNPDFDSSAHLENGHSPHDGVLRTVRMRKLSDSCHHDSEHNNNYKFKNYIQQRFSQDTSHHDDISVITDCSNKSPCPDVDMPCSKKPKVCLDFHESSSCDEKPSTNGITELKPEAHNNSSFPIFSKPNFHGNLMHHPVPIFALHSQGRFYVPLNVEYDSLVPYLGGTDLLEKNCGQLMAPLHTININVNFTNSSRLKGPLCQTRPQKLEMNGW